MSKKTEPARPEARLPKGLSDIPAGEIRACEDMLGTIRRVFESYGFEPLDTPAIEYSDALGKFLPDQDRPNEGVFSFKDDDEQWLSLRYDLTAPLARYVAENYQNLPKPFRRYQSGPVWRNEKPGPGRYRQFTQFDADTVGASSVAADAELCMLAADTLEALGVPRGQYVVKVNNRKILDGVLESNDVTAASQRLAVLRAIDKLDRLGLGGVRALLGEGRKDEVGRLHQGRGPQAEANRADPRHDRSRSKWRSEGSRRQPIGDRRGRACRDGRDQETDCGRGLFGQDQDRSHGRSRLGILHRARVRGRASRSHQGRARPARQARLGRERRAL